MSKYYHKAYGVGIESYCRLPGLPACEKATPDVYVRRGRVDVPIPEEEQEEFRKVWVDDDTVTIRWKGTANMLVREGREIILDPRSDTDPRIPGVIVVGTGIGVLLHQRGLVPLHGSAVSINGEAVVFIGGKRMGKSTTASAFYEAGYSFITDDICAIRSSEADDGVRLVPGGHSAKLALDASAKLGVPHEDLKPVYGRLAKRYRRMDRYTDAESVPLKRIYILEFLDDDGADPRIDSVNPRHALMHLVAHSFVLRFLKEGSDIPKDSLLKSTRIVRRVPMYRLQRPQDIDRLPDIITCVEEDLGVESQPLSTRG